MAEPLIDELLPGRALVDPDEDLEASEDVLEADDLTIEIDPPPAPLGRSLVMDFETGTLVQNGAAPAELRGDATLKGWIELCMRTARGAHVADPPGFGLTVPLNDMLGGNPDLLAQGEVVFRDALLFHPTITDLTNFAIDFDDETGEAEVSFTVVTEDGDTLNVSTADGRMSFGG